MKPEDTERQLSSTGAAPAAIHRVRGAQRLPAEDRLAIEEPLEIRLGMGADPGRARRSISITMRTPGNDFELALGFLFTEGIVGELSDVREIDYCAPSAATPGPRNIVRIDLNPGVEVDLGRLQRHFYTSSSCGVCGKTSIEALRTQSRFACAAAGPRVSAELIHGLPAALRASQALFDSTGGLHASALFSSEGKLLLLREDVGRHNALDKVIGSALSQGLLPLREQLLLVSGRASFELVQKASMAGITVFAAVGAPSSLALELARDCGMTLLGFVRDNRFNIYHGESRIIQ